MTAALTDDQKATNDDGVEYDTTNGVWSKKVDKTQTKADWQTTVEWPDDITVTNTKDGVADDFWTVKYTKSTSKVEVSE